jgi:hypothetical protein
MPGSSEITPPGFPETFQNAKRHVSLRSNDAGPHPALRATLSRKRERVITTGSPVMIE